MTRTCPIRRRAAPLLVLAAAVAGCAPLLRTAGESAAADCRRAAPAAMGSSAAPLLWSLPGGRSPELDAWCGGVGPAVLLPSPARSAEGPRDSLAIVTWNTHVGGGDLAGFVADLRAGRLTGGAPVADFVLLLQEVHRSGEAVPERAPPEGVPARVEGHPAAGERRDVVEAARALGLSALYVPSMRNGRSAPGGEREDRGNAILSTLALHDPRAVELPFEAQRRVAVAATVRGTTRSGEPWALLVSSAHLDTRSTGSRLWATFGAGRLRQARALVDGLPAGVPAVVAGDLNTWSLPALEGSLPFLRAAFPQTPPAPDLPTFATEWGFRRRLDHLFFRLPGGWEARYGRVDHRYGSDHHPLLAWTRMGGEAELHARRP